MKRRLWILAAITCLAICLLAGAAMADGLVLKDPNGTVLADGDSVSGQIYYKFYVEGIPEDCNGLYFSWTEDMYATEPGEWEEEPRGLDTEIVNGQIVRKVFWVFPELEGNYNQEIMFVRTDENSEVRRIKIYYDRSPVLAESERPVIENQTPPGPGQRDYTLNWSDVPGTEFYQVLWDVPGRNQYTYWNHENNLNLQDTRGDTTCYNGDYRVRVFAFAGGRILQVSDAWTFTLIAPDPVIQLSGENAESITEGDGWVTAPMHQWINFDVYAPGSNGVSVFCLDGEPETDGEWLRDLYGEDRERYIADCWPEADWDGFTWTPNDLPGDTAEDFNKYLVAEAYYNDWEERKLAVIPIHVTVDTAIEEAVTYTVSGDNIFAEGVPQVARDGLFYVDVDNLEGVDFYGMYIARQGAEPADHWINWIADSHWVPLSDGETTRVPLTVPRCVAGQDYEVHVYAIKFGAPQTEAAARATIHVTERENGDPDFPVILSMKPVYMTGEPLRVFAHYTNPADEEFPNGVEDGALQIRIYEKGNPGQWMFDNMQGFEDFWNEEACIWTPGTYVAEANIFQYGQVVRSYPAFFEFEVRADGGTVTAPQAAETFTTFEAGQNMVLHLSAPATDDTVMPDWFEYALFRLEWGHNFIAGGGADINPDDGTGTMTIDGSLFETGGAYVLQLYGMKRGCEVGTTEIRFAVTDANTPQHLTLTVNGSTESPREIDSSTNFHVRIAYTGERGKPTAVRILRGSEWECRWGENIFDYDWMFGDEELMIYAEASWDDIDFEELDRNHWQKDGRDFNWNEDVSWEARSNIVLVSVTSPNGVMAEPAFTLENGEGAIPWGTPLEITVEDEAPMATGANGGDPFAVPEGWFFSNMEVLRDEGNGNRWWDRVNRDYDYPIRSGSNLIPTYNLEENCVYRIEIGADAPGYSGRSRWIQFELGRKPETLPEMVSSFTVNGKTGSLSVQTLEELQLAAYRSGAGRYNVVIRKDGDEGWREDRDRWANGMLLDGWRTGNKGIYTLTAYAYGDSLPEEGEPLGTVTVTVTAEDDLDNPIAEMSDKVYIGDQLTLTFYETENAEEYSYWIHADDDGGWIMGDSRRSPGTLTIDTGRLNSGVYWVELDTMAKGYNQGHSTLHFALLDRNDTDRSAQDNSYYFTVSTLSVKTEEEEHFIAYMPGAEAVQLTFRKDNEETIQHLAYREGPGLSTWFSRGDSGQYEIYLSGCFEGTWSAPVTACTVTISADHTFSKAPTVKVNGSTTDTVTAKTGSNRNKLTVAVTRVTAAKGYHVQIRKYGDGEPFFDWFTDINQGEEENWITVGSKTITYTVEDGRIEPGQLYEIDCWLHAPGYECKGTHRLFLLQEGNPAGTVTLEVSPAGDNGFWTAEDVRIFVGAEGATGYKICMDNEPFFYSRNELDQDGNLHLRLNIWNEETVFHAYATTEDFEIPEGGGFDWNSLNWNMQSGPVYVHASTHGYIPEEWMPTLAFDDHVTKGDWFEFTIGNADHVRQIDVRIRDEEGHEREFRRMWGAGTYRFPTASLDAGERYRVTVDCIQDRYMWTSGEEMTLYVDAPAEEEDETPFFGVDKDHLYVNEPFIPMVYAPGAEHIWIGNTHDGAIWGDWEGDHGTNDADWEWWYDEPREGGWGLTAWAQYPGSDERVEIGHVEIDVEWPANLAQPDIRSEDAADASQPVYIEIPVIENARHYTLEVHVTDMENQPVFHYYKSADEAENGRITFTIDAGLLTPNTSYWIDCYADPADRDYAFRGSSSSKNIMTTNGGSRDSRITVTIEPDENVTVNEDGIFIPINTPFRVTVNADPDGEMPTAVAVYMGDHTEYAYFNDDDGSAVSQTIGMSEHQAWPETIFARAYYEDMSEYDEWEDVPWGNASQNTLQVTFTSFGPAGMPDIHDDQIAWATVEGEDIIIHVTLGENAHEAHANLDWNTSGWENLVFDDWIGWEEDPDHPGNGIIRIPTDGLGTHCFRVYVDSSGAGYDNNRATAWKWVVENPFENGSKLTLPSGLTEIEEEAFEGIAADTVIIPDTVTTIGRRAFANSRVRLVVIPESVQFISADAFENSRLLIVYGYQWTDAIVQMMDDNEISAVCIIGR